MGDSESLSFEFSLPEQLLNRIGLNNMRSKKEEDRQTSLDFFRLNADNSPNSFNVHDSLSEAELAFGTEANALKCFKKYLEINPNNENAKSIIAKLQNKQFSKSITMTSN